MRISSRLLVTLSAASLALVGACGGGGGGADGDAGVPDGGGQMGTPDSAPPPDGAPVPDAMPEPVLAIYEIIPQAASRLLTTDLTILGQLIESDATLTLTNCDTATVIDLSSTVTVAADGKSMEAQLAADETYEQGLYTVTVTNPSDGATDTLECGFRISAELPPTVTSVVPATAYAGMSGDGINSDTRVTITGTGFVSTPNVRWVKTDGSRAYDALEVGYISSTELTAVVPSETLKMEPGEYHVFVVNPNLLAGQWFNDTEEGIFTITITPPPSIDDITPARIKVSECGTVDGTITISGSNFDPSATVWWVAPEGTACTGAFTDESGNLLCPMAASNVTTTLMDADFTECPDQGAWPIVVRNPDGQSDIFFSVEIRPSNDGHLEATDFVELTPTLNTPRFKHGTQHGFDSFSNAYIYAAGGQDGSGNVLSTVERTQVNIFGELSEFVYDQQYGSAEDPRVDNLLSHPRHGATLLRVGKELFLVGGAADPTDTTAVEVSALATVDRASILSYYEMPFIKLPEDIGDGSLPLGSWYYRVSAIGPWGESLGSREVIAFQADGRVQVCWDAPQAAGTVSYNVYRSLASDGRAQSTALIATEVTGPCFIDDGTDTLAAAPGNIRGDATTGSGLAAGIHRYRVSAHLTLSGGGDWETYASYAAAIELTEAGAIQLSWDAIPNATGYSIYRQDSGTGDYLLLDTSGPIADTTYTDDGALFADPAVLPREEIATLPPGTLSLWDSTSTPAMGIAREGLDGVVVAMTPDDPAVDPIARILVAGGRTQNSDPATDSDATNDTDPWYLTTAESLAIYSDGSTDDTWFQEAPEFNFARSFYALVTTQNRNSTPFPPDPEEPPCGDFDNDGYISCDCGGDDCNDGDASVNPGASEICGDGLDQDCDAGCSGGSDIECTCETDLDGDGVISPTCGGNDCCDSGSEDSLGCSTDTADGIQPGAQEICENGIDEDCDGFDDSCIVIEAWGDDEEKQTSPSDPQYVSADITLTASTTSGSEPVYVVACLGDDAFAASNNGGRNDFEACSVGDDGHLNCGEFWIPQGVSLQHNSFAMDALLYFDYLYPMWGLQSETVSSTEDPTGTIRSMWGDAFPRVDVEDPNVDDDGDILGGNQSANVKFAVPRAYYGAQRLMAYIYLVGGWTDAGPTGSIERHQQ